jgi:hypothetical protein
MREEGGRGRREWGGRREEGGGRREEGGGRREEGERFSVQRENEGGWTGEPPSS